MKILVLMMGEFVSRYWECCLMLLVQKQTLNLEKFLSSYTNLLLSARVSFRDISVSETI